MLLQLLERHIPSQLGEVQVELVAELLKSLVDLEELVQQT
jgi:hypothetical protein